MAARSLLLQQWVAARPATHGTMYFPVATVSGSATSLAAAAAAVTSVYASACSSSPWATQGGVRPRAVDEPTAAGGVHSKAVPPAATESLLSPVLTDFPLPIARADYAGWPSLDFDADAEEPVLAMVLPTEPEEEEGGNMTMKEERTMRPTLYQPAASTTRTPAHARASSNQIAAAGSSAFASSAAAAAATTLDDALAMPSTCSDSVASRRLLDRPSLLSATHAWWLCFCPNASSRAIMPLGEFLRVRLATLVYLAGDTVSAFHPSSQLALLGRAAQRDFLVEADCELFERPTGTGPTTTPSANSSKAAPSSSSISTKATSSPPSIGLGLSLPKFHRGLAQLALFFSPSAPEELLAQMLASLTCRVSEMHAKQTAIDGAAIAAAAKVAAHSAVAPSPPASLSGSPKATTASGAATSFGGSAAFYLSPFAPRAPPLLIVQAQRLWRTDPIDVVVKTRSSTGSIGHHDASSPSSYRSAHPSRPGPLVTQILAQLMRNTRATASSASSSSTSSSSSSSSTSDQRKARMFCIRTTPASASTKTPSAATSKSADVSLTTPPTASGSTSASAASTAAAAAAAPLGGDPSSTRSHLDPRVLAPLPLPVASCAAVATSQFALLATLVAGQRKHHGTSATSAGQKNGGPPAAAAAAASSLASSTATPRGRTKSNPPSSKSSQAPPCARAAARAIVRQLCEQLAQGCASSGQDLSLMPIAGCAPMESQSMQHQQHQQQPASNEPTPSPPCTPRPSTSPITTSRAIVGHSSASASAATSTTAVGAKKSSMRRKAKKTSTAAATSAKSKKDNDSSSTASSIDGAPATSISTPRGSGVATPRNTMPADGSKKLSANAIALASSSTTPASSTSLEQAEEKSASTTTAAAAASTTIVTMMHSVCGRPITPLLVPLSRVHASAEEDGGEDSEPDDMAATSIAASPVPLPRSSIPVPTSSDSSAPRPISSVAVPHQQPPPPPVKLEEEKRISPPLQPYNAAPSRSEQGLMAGSVAHARQQQQQQQPQLPQPFRPKSSSVENRTATKMLPNSSSVQSHAPQASPAPCLPPHHPSAATARVPSTSSAASNLSMAAAMTSRPLSRRAPAPPSLLVAPDSSSASVGPISPGRSPTHLSTPSSPVAPLAFAPSPPAAPSPAHPPHAHGKTGRFLAQASSGVVVMPVDARRSVVSAGSAFGVVLLPSNVAAAAAAAAAMPKYSSSSSSPRDSIIRTGSSASAARRSEPQALSWTQTFAMIEQEKNKQLLQQHLQPRRPPIHS